MQDGILDRSWVAGVLPSEVMISHIFTQFLVLLIQTGLTLVFIFAVFEIPCNGPVGWIVVIAILQGFAGMCFGKWFLTFWSQQKSLIRETSYFHDSIALQTDRFQDKKFSILGYYHSNEVFCFETYREMVVSDTFESLSKSLKTRKQLNSL